MAGGGMSIWKLLQSHHKEQVEPSSPVRMVCGTFSPLKCFPSLPVNQRRQTPLSLQKVTVQKEGQLGFWPMNMGIVPKGTLENNQLFIGKACIGTKWKTGWNKNAHSKHIQELTRNLREERESVVGMGDKYWSWKVHGSSKVEEENDQCFRKGEYT